MNLILLDFISPRFFGIQIVKRSSIFALIYTIKHGDLWLRMKKKTELMDQQSSKTNVSNDFISKTKKNKLKLILTLLF